MPVKPGLTSRKSPIPFRLLPLHELYVHICVPNIILFAAYSPQATSCRTYNLPCINRARGSRHPSRPFASSSIALRSVRLISH